MKAAVLYETRFPLVIEELDLSEPGAGEVMVKVMAAGVCHSDWHVVKGDWANITLPMVLGHEASGVVEAVGPAVTIDARALFYEKTVMGSYLGSDRPHVDIPRRLSLYKAGKLKLDELITRRFRLEQINSAFDALEEREVARGVISFE